MTESKYLIVPHLNTKQIRRLFSKITVNPQTGCWEFSRNLNPQGYGKINYGGKGRYELAHRLMYAWAVEPIPRRKRGEVREDWLELDHFVCSNTRCCNPVHLKLVTTKENTLRSNSPIALSARKTHCIHGHLLPTGPNRQSKGKWRRRCLPCQLVIESRRPPRPYRKSAKTQVLDH